MSQARRPTSAIERTGGQASCPWPVSPLLTAAITTLVGVWLFRWVAPVLWRQWNQLWRVAGGWDIQAGSPPNLSAALWPMVETVLAVSAGLAAVAMVATLVQQGSLPAAPWTQATPHFGFKPRQWGFMPLAAVVLVVVGGGKTWQLLPHIQTLFAEGRTDSLRGVLFDLVHTLAWSALAFGLLDLAWRHRRRLVECEALREAGADGDDIHPLFRRQMRERMSSSATEKVA